MALDILCMILPFACGTNRRAKRAKSILVSRADYLPFREVYTEKIRLVWDYDEKTIEWKQALQRFPNLNEFEVHDCISQSLLDFLAPSEDEAIMLPHVQSLNFLAYAPAGRKEYVEALVQGCIDVIHSRHNAGYPIHDFTLRLWYKSKEEVCELDPAIEGRLLALDGSDTEKITFANRVCDCREDFRRVGPCHA
jgi:hypothetical protein